MSDAPSPDAMICLSVATAIPGIFGFLCPAPLDQDGHDGDAVRGQQTKAVAASLALGVAATAVAKRPWPLIVAVVMVAVLLGEYQVHHLWGDS